MHPHAEHYQALERMLDALVAEFAKRLPASDLAEVREYYVEHNEFEVAYSLLIGLLREQNVSISQPEFERIIAIGKKMALDPDQYWEPLREAVR
jgi:hypothetical protein